MAAFMVSQRREYEIPHVVACQALGVSAAWFYEWPNGDVSVRRVGR